MIGINEILVIIAAILVFFGGKDAAYAVKKIAKGINEFKRVKMV